ncbi:MAG TPA: PEP-CTERM sorting domain-containing protein [Pirellulales bacterium]|nr:PEP-CTERM sorting domain-containing protein [Pirellulales bacterium]
MLLNSPAWSVSTYTAAYTRFLDLSSTTTLDNQATLYFRLADASTSSIGGGTVASTGTDRVDNVIVTSPPVATAIPEPSSIVLCGLALLGLAGTARFRKKN